MVEIQRPSLNPRRLSIKKLTFILVAFLCFSCFLFLSPSSSEGLRNQARGACEYQSFSDLSAEELAPHKGQRHMITPPEGGEQTLVCCETTVGPWNIVVHHKWAPLGAARFLEMVNVGYFSSQIPLMRCVKNFLCQFGLAGDPKLNRKYRSAFADDPNWLPEGPNHRQNEDGVKRFAKGYLAYAGGGKNTRGNQFIVALKSNGPLAGGSPWEVPWGELVGGRSFETLDKIYTGYGENGPSQGLLSNHGVTDEIRQKFPKLDYLTACEVLENRVVEN